MESWQTILLAFGGNTALLAVLGLIGNSLLEKMQPHDSLGIETGLKTKSAVDLKNLRSTLAVATAERYFRFSKRHEQRAEVVAETYGLLRELRSHLGNYIKIFETPADKPKEERRSFLNFRAPVKFRLGQTLNLNVMFSRWPFIMNQLAQNKQSINRG